MHLTQHCTATDSAGEKSKGTEIVKKDETEKGKEKETYTCTPTHASTHARTVTVSIGTVTQAWLPFQ